MTGSNLDQIPSSVLQKAASRLLGRAGEQLAERHLVANGLITVERNFLCRHGEIDLVMRDCNTLVFVEVRLRRKSRFASAAASVGPHKQRKLIRTAGIYLGRRRRFRHHVIRFDVVALETAASESCPTGDKFRIQWLKDAFRPGDWEF